MTDRNVQEEKRYNSYRESAIKAINAGFTAKAHCKNACDFLNRAHYAAKSMIQNHYLAAEQRTPEMQDLYYDLPDLHAWKEKHSKVVLRVFPAAADLVVKVEELVALRKKAIEMPIQAKATPEQVIRTKIAKLIDSASMKPVFESVTKSLAQFDAERLERQQAEVTRCYNEFMVVMGAPIDSIEYHDKIKASAWTDGARAAKLPFEMVALFQFRELADVLRMTKSSFEMRCLERDYKIAEKLVGIKVTAIEEVKVISAVDGYNGHFAVETAQGRKIIEINTIFAGGYNIQRLHERVLVTIK